MPKIADIKTAIKIIDDCFGFNNRTVIEVRDAWLFIKAELKKPCWHISPDKEKCKGIIGDYCDRCHYKRWE